MMMRKSTIYGQEEGWYFPDVLLNENSRRWRPPLGLSAIDSAEDDRNTSGMHHSLEDA